MAFPSEAKLENLSKYLFDAPAWPRSLGIIILLGIAIDVASSHFGDYHRFFGTLEFTIPAILAFVLTKPLTELTGSQMTWNRSGLLAFAMAVFGVIITFLPVFIAPSLFELFFAVGLGVIFGLRLLVLVAIASYRVVFMLLPALLQSLAATVFAVTFFGPQFLLLSVVAHLLFGGGFLLLIWLIERPLKKSFNIRLLKFLNAFLAHLTDGSKSLEEFFIEIGEEIYIPQVSLFFRRVNATPVLITVPNVHPGPMGEIGGGNLPTILANAFPGNVMVPHGCATHDFNLVSEKEGLKIIDAVEKTVPQLAYTAKASKSQRYQYGSVSLLAQRFGEGVLLIGTRSPSGTEDLEFGLGLAIMSEGHSIARDIAFVDAHNCLTDDVRFVNPGTLIGTEYFNGAKNVFSDLSIYQSCEFKIGYSQKSLPFTREQGIGDNGVQVLVIETGDQKTGYILIDGNNLAQGVREDIRNAVIGLVDEAEIMTTDSHVVNTTSGKNPVGMKIAISELLPFILTTLREALSELIIAEVASSTAACEKVKVFGSQRIAQLAATVNAILVYIAPLSVAVLLLAFILSMAAFLIIV